MTDKMTVGKRIQLKRRGKGLSQQDLAHMLGVSRSLIGQIETNKSNPTLEHLNKMIRIFDTSYDYLLEGKSVPSAFAGLAFEEQGSYDTAGSTPVNWPSTQDLESSDLPTLRMHARYQSEIISLLKSENLALRQGLAALSQLITRQQPD